MSAGRLILPALRWKEGSGFAHEEGAIAEALRLGVGGFIVFGGTRSAVRALTADLLRRAGRPLLLAADLERGAGQQVRGLTEFPPPAALAWLGNPAAIRWAAAVTAHEARGVGLNWILAPVADLDLHPDNPIVQTRAFGASPIDVAEQVRTWVLGCQEGGALCCAKHYPGHGRTSRDSHDTLPAVSADADLLREEDRRPFRAAVEAGVAAVMTAHVSYEALDPGVPATFSAAILDTLRRDLRFEGLVVTDALIMKGAQAAEGRHPAVEAVLAGCDLLLYPERPAEALAALEQALRDGVLPAAKVDQAVGRVEAALARVPPAPAGPFPSGPFQSAEALADALLAAGEIRGRVGRIEPPVEIVIVDDDVVGAWPASPSDVTARTLDRQRVARAEGGTRIVLAFSEPRASKGRGGFGPAAREELLRAAEGAKAVVLFGHPRLAAELPGDLPVLLAWHRQRLMQEAVGRWIEARAW